MATHATDFTRLVGCRLPLQQAAMGGVTTPALAGAVARAGGLGMLAAAGAPADVVLRDLDSALADGGGPVGVNFLMPFLDGAAFAAVARIAPVVECFYGEPDAGLVAVAHDAGALVGWQTGSVAETERAVAAGCHYVVVQGDEAGGHVRGREPLATLLPAARAAVDVPLVAAGGIGTAADVERTLAAGADAVRVGTRFVVATESAAHPAYVEALVAAGPDDTVLTTAFSLGWPDAPHRVLRACIDAGEGDRWPTPPRRGDIGPVDAMAMYAGRSVAAVTGTSTVADVVAELFPD